MCKFNKPTIPAEATADERRELMFNALYSADLSEEVEKKNNLSYVSWSQAWKVMKQFYPSARYTIHTNPNTGLPYFESELGIMVHTSVEADGLCYDNWLPVMDYQNRSLKTVPYSVTVYDKFKKQNIEKRIEAATTFEINTSVQRSLCKCMSMHGLALRLYSGMDFTDNDSQSSSDIQPEIPSKVASVPSETDAYGELRNKINSTTDVTSLVSIYMENTQLIESNQEIKNLLTLRKQALQTLK